MRGIAHSELQLAQGLGLRQLRRFHRTPQMLAGGMLILRLAIGGLALLIAVSTAHAAAPTAAQKAEFYQVCLGISGDQALCACKADAAMDLVDERMMGYVIAGMKGAGNAPADVQKRWNAYVAESNRVCKPGY